MSSAATSHVTIRLAIEVGSDPISGQVQVGDAVPSEFHSWLDLIAALDQAKNGDEDK